MKAELHGSPGGETLAGAGSLGVLELACTSSREPTIHKGGLKLATVRVFTPRKLVNAFQGSLCPPPEEPAVKHASALPLAGGLREGSPRRAESRTPAALEG